MRHGGPRENIKHDGELPTKRPGPRFDRKRTRLAVPTSACDAAPLHPKDLNPSRTCASRPSACRNCEMTDAQTQRDPIEAARNPPPTKGAWKVPHLSRLRLLCALENPLADRIRKVRRDSDGPNGNGAGRLRDACRKRAGTQRPDPIRLRVDTSLLKSQ